MRMTTLRTLPDAIRRAGLPDEQSFTHVIGNSLCSRMADARTTIRYRLLEGGSISAEDAAAGNPSQGGTSRWNREYMARIEDAPDGQLPEMKANRKLVRPVIRGYVVAPRAIARLRDFVELARTHGIQLVLAELPAAGPVRSVRVVHEAMASVRSEVVTLAQPPCVRTWTVDQIDEAAEFGPHSFRDPSHLNAHGAKRFVELITPVIAGALADGACR